MTPNKNTDLNNCWSCGRTSATLRNPPDARGQVRQDVYDYYCRCGNQTFLAHQTSEQASEAWNRENPKEDEP